jgi:tetratricopeptide (TPR) repeat protein
MLSVLFLTLPQVNGYSENCRDYRSKLYSYSEWYSKCSNLFDKAFESWYDNYGNWNYKEAIDFFEIAKKYVPDSSAVKTNISLSLWWNAGNEFDKKNYKEASRYYNSVIYNDYENLYEIYIRLAESYFYMDESIYSKRVWETLTEAIDYAKTQAELDNIEWYNYYFQGISIAPTNDTYSWVQYYLHSMNIPEAWNKVTNDNEVIVAVIDDGIYLNHPDLEGKIWEDKNATYGESKIIDFVWDGIDNFAAWEHGTMVSGIIAAEQNNNEWIAWIGKNVKIMPLRVFDLEGNSNWIIEAINYAVDNEANIINLSLGQNQFKYSTDYDEVIKKAYDNNVIVVIAAWNWDVLSSWETWVDLSENPITPVCNNAWNYNKYSIGVYASDEKGWRTNWTNYWDCASFMAPWEGIVSTSVPIFNETYGNNYNELDGTSFSAPIISGIIALWYNQYWEILPDVVYDSLVESLTENSVWNYIVNASSYIDILWEYVNEKNTSDNHTVLKNKYKGMFNEKIWEKLKQYPEEVLNILIIRVNEYLKKEVNNDTKAKLEAFIELVEELL